MPGCVLRATGDKFEPHDFLNGSSFKSCNVYKKGEHRGRTSIWGTSGFTVEVSAAAGDDLAQQIQDAVEFLRKNSDEMVRLVATQALEDVRLILA